MFISRTVSEIFSIKKSRDLETGDMGSSRSLKIAPFDRYRTFYWSAIEVGLCYVVSFSSYFTLNNRDLEKVTEGYSNYYNLKACVRLLIRRP